MRRDSRICTLVFIAGSGVVELFFSSLWLAVMVWLIARALQQRGLLSRLEPAFPPSADRAPHISVIVPARDEEANIGSCLGSLLAHDYPRDQLQIVVVDDHSADATAAIVEELARAHPQITFIRSPPLPPRWTGKTHACAVGVRRSHRQRMAVLHRCRCQRRTMRAVERLRGSRIPATRPALADAAPRAENVRRTAHYSLRAHAPVLHA